MLYKCVRGYSDKGSPVKVGEIVELTEDTAAILVFYKKLVPFVDDAVQVRDPVIEHRDPVVQHTGRKPRGR